MSPRPPRLSVCIPAYNRAGVLPELLDSIVSQDHPSFGIVICEDASPERERIAEVVRSYQARHPGLITYVENERNLGYDGNLRRLVERADGDYCVFMGNDDVLAPGALAAIGDALSRSENVGVLVRSYAMFDGTPDRITQEFRYFPDERFFPAGPDAIVTCYRRSVVISGMVLHRGAALRWATDRFDGTLLYQLHLVGNILVEMNGLYTPRILALYRIGATPDFGNSESERGHFTPREQTPESSVHFMAGMLDIARQVEADRGVPVFARIRSDIGNYSYTVLHVQARRPKRVFAGYAYRIARQGFWRSPMFHAYFLSLLLLGPERVDRLIAFIKRKIGHAPRIGRVYGGRPT